MTVFASLTTKFIRQNIHRKHSAKIKLLENKALLLWYMHVHKMYTRQKMTVNII